MGSVDLEERPQCLPSVGPAETVGAEHRHRARGPAVDLADHTGHPVRYSDDRPLAALQLGRDPRDETLPEWVEPVPSLNVDGVLAEALVGGDAPQLGSHVVLLGQDGLGLLGGEVRRAGKQDGRPVSTVAEVRAVIELVQT